MGSRVPTMCSNSARCSKRSNHRSASTRPTEPIELGGQLEDRVGHIAELATPAGVSPPDLGSATGVEDLSSGLAVADDQVAALERIVEVERQLDAASGFTTWGGRWGSDTEGDLDEARSQLAHGDNDATLATLASADDQIDGLSASGALRLAIAGAVVLVLVGVLALMRRRRNPPAPAAISRDQPSVRDPSR